MTGRAAADPRLALPVKSSDALPRLVTVKELAEILGRSPAYVYENSSALGAIRLPSRPQRPGETGTRKPRLAFDLDRTLALLGLVDTGSPSLESIEAERAAQSEKSPRPRPTKGTSAPKLAVRRREVA